MAGWTKGYKNTDSVTLMTIGNKGDTRLINSNNFEFVISTGGPIDELTWHSIAQASINRDPEFGGPCVNNTEVVINTNGGHDENEWILVTHKDITITAGNDAWKIPLTFATGGINMPVELEDLRENNIFEDNFTFNTKNYQHSGLMSSKPTIAKISTIEDMLLGGTWRTPHEDYVILVEEFTFNTKKYKSAGLMSSKPIIVNIPVREQLVIDGDHWRTPWETAALPVGAFKIAGSGTHDGRVLIIDEDTWEVEQTKLVSEGSYEVTGLQSGLKTVVDRKSDGESAAFGAVEAVSEE